MKNKELENRKGRIQVSPQLFESMDLWAIKLFHSNFYTSYVDNTLVDFNKHYVYYGYSEHFDLLINNEGEEIPLYDAIFDSELKTIKFERYRI